MIRKNAMKSLFMLSVSIFLVHTSSLKANDFEPEKETFVETFDTNVPVSGSVILGVSLSENVIPTESLKLYTYTKPSLSWLCLSIKSIDGQYLASSLYHTDIETPQWVSLKFPSKYKQTLREYKDLEIAVLINAYLEKPNCYQKGKTLISSWNPPVSLDKQLVNIFINSNRINSLIRFAEDKGTPINCKSINSPSQVSYDKICQIPFSEIQNGKWNLIRKRMGKRIPAYNFDIFAKSTKIINI
ncbi:MAG: hypothetical protein L3J83_01060 [Proteobacteria bacterium]|nr:hypothetical protein [Pseudomonadota bacterium]